MPWKQLEAAEAIEVIDLRTKGIVDDDLFTMAPRQGRIAGAGLDVFENEPPTGSPLLSFDNVILSPHRAAFTREALPKPSMGIVAQLATYSSGEAPAHLVNPEVYDQH